MPHPPSRGRTRAHRCCPQYRFLSSDERRLIYCTSFPRGTTLDGRTVGRRCHAAFCARNREGCDVYVQPYAYHCNPGYVLVELDGGRPTTVSLRFSIPSTASAPYQLSPHRSICSGLFGRRMASDYDATIKVVRGRSGDAIVTGRVRVSNLSGAGRTIISYPLAPGRCYPRPTPASGASLSSASTQSSPRRRRT